MSDEKLKEINIKNRKYYYRDNLIYISSLCPKNLVIDEKSYDSLMIYHTRYKIQYSLKEIYFHELTGQFEEYGDEKILDTYYLRYKVKLSFWLNKKLD